MKSIGKIVVMVISLFVLSAIFWFINIENGGEGIHGIGLIIAIGFSWFISYSKWADDNIWNTKINIPNKSSDIDREIEESDEKSLNDNKNILGDINLPSLGNLTDNKEEILQKIEELKRQIEVLEESLNKNKPVQELKIEETSNKINEEEPLFPLFDENKFYIAALIIIIIVLFLANSDY